MLKHFLFRMNILIKNIYKKINIFKINLGKINIEINKIFTRLG